MKSFSRPRYRIGNAPAEIKWIYTFFLIFLVIGFATVGGYEFGQIGFGAQAIAEHYRGSSENGDGMAFAKSFSSLLETTHFHAFIMGIIYLTLAHLFVATESPKPLKLTLVGTGFFFTILDLLLPWVIRYGSAGFAPLLLASWMGEWVAYMGMILISLYDLWLRPSPPEDEVA
jgi:hypothetical protein